MSYYTEVGKKHHCPMWGINLTLIGKYHFYDEDNPHVARYMHCKCPIIENLKLPVHERNKAYSLFQFCNKEVECLLSADFKPKIDLRKDDYSQ